MKAKKVSVLVLLAIAAVAAATGPARRADVSRHPTWIDSRRAGI